MLRLHKLNTPTVLTRPQRDIFDKVKKFILENRRSESVSPSQMRAARLALPNTFPARERKFISTLSDDLNLAVAWDEYDDNDQNLVTIRFPGVGAEEAEDEGAGDGEGEWEDVDEGDEEGQEAVDRVLKKYAKAPVMNDDEEGDFERRHEQGVKEKMDEWKRNYYTVSASPMAIYLYSVLSVTHA